MAFHEDNVDAYLGQCFAVTLQTALCKYKSLSSRIYMQLLDWKKKRLEQE